MEKRENLSFAYSTKELAGRFLEETDRDDYMSARIARKNLAEMLNGKFSINLKETEVNDNYRSEKRWEIINAIDNAGFSFEYLALMLTDEHPLLKGWSERSQRIVLHYTLGKKILGFENNIVSLRLDEVRFGDKQTEKDIKKEMTPYKKFQQDLLRVVVPLPKAFRK